MLKEFKDFAIRGSVVDMAIGIIIGSSFGSIVNSIVEDIIMPPIGILLSGVDFSNMFLILKEGSTPKPYTSLTTAKEVGAVTLNYGIFINSIISFLIVAFIVFLLVKSINRMKHEEDIQQPKPDTKQCQFCFSEISIQAVRCPHCTSELG
jgi:large conductance mechanosensitive channel